MLAKISSLLKPLASINKLKKKNTKNVIDIIHKTFNITLVKYYDTHIEQQRNTLAIATLKNSKAFLANRMYIINLPVTFIKMQTSLNIQFIGISQLYIVQRKIDSRYLYYVAIVSKVFRMHVRTLSFIKLYLTYYALYDM